MNLRSLILALFGMFSLIGCSPDELPITVDVADNQLVVASLIAPEDYILVSLSRSFSTLSATDIYEISDDFAQRLLLDSAFVTISHEGFTDTLIQFLDTPGLYATQVTNIENDQALELFVYDSLTNSSISALSRLMAPATIDSSSLIKIDSLQFNSNYYANLTLDIRDPVEEKNFYIIHAYQFYEPGDSVAEESNLDLFFDTNTNLILESLITDRIAENGTIRIETPVYFETTIDSALIVVTNIEEGYYRYLDARRRSGDLLTDLFNEPVNHPTNIENGVGYFSAHQPRLRLIKIKEPEE